MAIILIEYSQVSIDNIQMMRWFRANLVPRIVLYRQDSLH